MTMVLKKIINRKVYQYAFESIPEDIYNFGYLGKNVTIKGNCNFINSQKIRIEANANLNFSVSPVAENVIEIGDNNSK